MRFVCSDLIVYMFTKYWLWKCCKLFSLKTLTHTVAPVTKCIAFTFYFKVQKNYTNEMLLHHEINIYYTMQCTPVFVDEFSVLLCPCVGQNVCLTSRLLHNETAPNIQQVLSFYVMSFIRVDSNRSRCYIRPTSHLWGSHQIPLQDCLSPPQKHLLTFLPHPPMQRNSPTPLSPPGWITATHFSSGSPAILSWEDANMSTSLHSPCLCSNSIHGLTFQSFKKSLEIFLFKKHLPFTSIMLLSPVYGFLLHLFLMSINCFCHFGGVTLEHFETVLQCNV